MKQFALAALIVAGCNVSPGNNRAADGAVGAGQVNMSNIDVSSEVGADRLLRRIRDGAQARCHIGQSRAGEGIAEGQQVCMRAAMASAVLRVESPIVAARFARVGEAMIVAAIPNDADVNRDAPAAAQSTNSGADLATSARRTLRARLTTDELNRREAARVRATNRSDDQAAVVILSEG